MSDGPSWADQGSETGPPAPPPDPPRTPSEPTAPVWPPAGRQLPGAPDGAGGPHRPDGYGSIYGPGGTAAYPPGGTAAYPSGPAGGFPPSFGGAGQAPYGGALGGAPHPPSPPLPAPGTRARGRALRSAAAVLVVAAAAITGAALGHVAWPSTEPASSASPSTTAPAGQGAGGSSTGPADVAEIAAKVDPAVVDVNVQFSYQNAAGAGTGIVISPNGLVLTNNHVIDEATNASVTDIGNGRTYNATVLGYDNTHDVALLKLQGASGLATASIASAPATVGEPVVAIGNAGGTGGVPSAAVGTVTALDQDITASDALTQSSESLSGLIETSADVQSGDSGGPLVNSSGEVVGMDTAATGSFAFSQTGNQGFAIPIARAMAIAKVIESGRGTATVHVGPTAFIGLRLYSESNPNPNLFPGGANGLEVYAVVPGTGAAKAGIAQGDVLTKFNGAELSSDTQLSHLLVPYHPGERVKVSWETPTGQDESATIKLSSGPPA